MQVHAYAERRSKSWNGPAGSSRGALHDDENGAERKKLVRHERKLTAHPLMPKRDTGVAEYETPERRVNAS